MKFLHKVFTSFVAVLFVFAPAVSAQDEAYDFVAIVSCDQIQETVKMKVLRNVKGVNVAQTEKVRKGHFIHDSFKKHANMHTKALFSYSSNGIKSRMHMTWIQNGHVRINGQRITLEKYLKSLGIEDEIEPKKKDQKK